MHSRDHSGTGSSDASTLYTVQFTFTPSEYDDEFHRLNDRIDEIAHETPGFLGKEWWESPDGDTQSVLYFWESLEALETFSKNPDHIEAKRRYEEWYEGYEIRISEVIEEWGDGGLDSD